MLGLGVTLHWCNFNTLVLKHLFLLILIVCMCALLHVEAKGVGSP